MELAYNLIQIQIRKTISPVFCYIRKKNQSYQEKQQGYPSHDHW